jgi:methionyl-tRNA formyltransferase
MLVVIAFRILPKVLFGLPKHGSLNVHPSLLPKGRGPAPIRWTLINGETETGVTIIQLSEQIDGGAILAQESTAILPEENFGTLHDRLAVIGATLLADVLSKIESGNPPKPLPQDETAVTKAPKLYPKDFEINWNLTAPDIHNRIRAFSPEPGAATFWNGVPFKILIVKEARDHRYEPGKLIRNDNELLAGTGSHALRLIVVKPAGKRAMETAEFLRGRPVVPDFLGK